MFYLALHHFSSPFHRSSGTVDYKVIAATTLMGPHRLDDIGCSFKVYTQGMKYVTSGIGCQGTILIANASLWWPYLMSENAGYQYTFVVGKGGVLKYSLLVFTHVR